MNYKEMYNLINEFGLKREDLRIKYKDYTVATINTSLINQSTGKNAYRLDFISSNVCTMKYEIAKKTTAKRISIIKEVIIHNKKIEIEKDFIE